MAIHFCKSSRKLGGGTYNFELIHVYMIEYGSKAYGEGAEMVDILKSTQNITLHKDFTACSTLLQFHSPYNLFSNPITYVRTRIVGIAL